MADGIVCIHCGRYETDHELGLEEANKKVPGYKVPLTECPCYEPEDEKLSKRLEQLAAEEKKRRLKFDVPYD